MKTCDAIDQLFRVLPDSMLGEFEALCLRAGLMFQCECCNANLVVGEMYCQWCGIVPSVESVNPEILDVTG